MVRLPLVSFGNAPVRVAIIDVGFERRKALLNGWRWQIRCRVRAQRQSAEGNSGYHKRRSEEIVFMVVLIKGLMRFHEFRRLTRLFLPCESARPAPRWRQKSCRRRFFRFWPLWTITSTALVQLLVGHDQFDFDFRQEVHGVFAAAIDFGVALLAAKSLDFAHGHAFDANFAEGIFDFLELERFDDRFNFFHFMLG